MAHHHHWDLGKAVLGDRKAHGMKCCWRKSRLGGRLAGGRRVTSFLPSVGTLSESEETQAGAAPSPAGQQLALSGNEAVRGDREGGLAPGHS